MQQEAASALREELSAPAQRIVDAAGLLLQRDGNALPPRFATYLQRIHLAGRNLLERVDQVAELMHQDTDGAGPSLARHELRTPVTHVLGYCELLQEEAEDALYQALGPDLARILSAGREILEIIERRLS